MPKKLTLLHTVAALAGSLTVVCKEVMPDVDVSNFVDESI
jgi:hypothetical protein